MKGQWEAPPEGKGDVGWVDKNSPKVQDTEPHHGTNGTKLSQGKIHKMTDQVKGLNTANQGGTGWSGSGGKGRG